MAANSTDVFWFLQVSDTHLSRWHDERQVQFSLFCRDVVKRVVKPKFVIATGDIADAKLLDSVCLAGMCVPRGGMQESEYVSYKTILEDNGFLNRTFWMDVRGNHDTYGTSFARSMPGVDAKAGKNYFDLYTTTGMQQTSSTPYPFQLDNDEEIQSLSYTASEEDGNIDSKVPNATVFAIHFKKGSTSFMVMSVDYSPLIGLPSPINFYGVSTKATDRALQMALDDAQARNVTMAMVAAHYPITSIVSRMGTVSPMTLIEQANKRVRTSPIQGGAGGVVAYLCGHYHVEKGYVRRNEGVLELEADDMKGDKGFRVIAVDNGLFSLSEQTLEEYPIIVITYPKDERFMSPNEALHLLQSPSAVRALAFSNSSIQSVHARVWTDGRRHAQYDESGSIDFEMHPVNGVEGLFEASLDGLTAQLSQTRYTVAVKVVDSSGQERVLFQTSTTSSSAPAMNSLTSLWIKLDFVAVAGGLLALANALLCGALLLLPLIFVAGVRKFGSLESVVSMCREVDHYYGARMMRNHKEKSLKDLLKLEFLGIMARYGRIPPWIAILSLLSSTFVSIGPIAVGPLLEGQWAIVFSFGSIAFLHGAGVPGGSMVGWVPLQLPTYLAMLWILLVALPSVYIIALPFSRRGIREAYKVAQKNKEGLKKRVTRIQRQHSMRHMQVVPRINTYLTSPKVLRTPSLLISAFVGFAVLLLGSVVTIICLALYNAITVFVSPIFYLTLMHAALSLFVLLRGHSVYLGQSGIERVEEE
uniref:TMEM62 Ig-like domain-containing protein n=1 Tax=Palpitomonas bilix TaxID=652834 RepID=A0A7S3DAK4_9EUKA